MKVLVRSTLALVLALAQPVATATDFGVMETADPIQIRQFKFQAYPIFARAQPTQERETGVAAGFGYGLGRRADAEVLVASYDDASFVGADVEYVWFRTDHLDASLVAGAHFADTDFGEQLGADLSQLLTWWVPSVPRLAINAAVDLAYDELDRTRGAVTRGVAGHWTSAHLVPGVQYRVAPRVDFFIETGLGLNDDSREYLGGGLSMYFE